LPTALLGPADAPKILFSGMLNQITVSVLYNFVNFFRQYLLLQHLVFFADIQLKEKLI
jgi:hypothetical protein